MPDSVHKKIKVLKIMLETAWRYKKSFKIRRRTYVT